MELDGSVDQIKNIADELTEAAINAKILGADLQLRTLDGKVWWRLVLNPLEGDDIIAEPGAEFDVSDTNEITLTLPEPEEPVSEGQIGTVINGKVVYS